MSALHITNGDSAAGTLREFIDDPVIITADPLFDGPAPDVDDEEWYLARSGHLTGGPGGSDAFSRDLARSDRAIADAAGRKEIVLWFEHDLFDQLLLIRTLDRIGRATEDLRGVWLICIDRFPGVDRFIGLGQLTAAELSTLVGARQPVTSAHVAAASRAWRAFRSADPTTLAALATTREPSLPFLQAALARFLAEYPSTRNGLSESADAILQALADGPLDAGRAFVKSQHGERSPFMGDWSAFDIMRRLAGARLPLVEIDGEGVGPDLRGCAVTLTDAGAAVLSGRLDAVAANGIDEWRGGVHLVGRDRSPWRWDGSRETLVSLS